MSADKCDLDNLPSDSQWIRKNRVEYGVSIERDRDWGESAGEYERDRWGYLLKPNGIRRKTEWVPARTFLYNYTPVSAMGFAEAMFMLAAGKKIRRKTGDIVKEGYLVTVEDIKAEDWEVVE